MKHKYIIKYLDGEFEEVYAEYMDTEHDNIIVFKNHFKDKNLPDIFKVVSINNIKYINIVN